MRPKTHPGAGERRSGRRPSGLTRAALAAALGAGVALAAAAPAHARVIERVVAVVNHSIILLSELDARVTPLLPELQRVPAGEARQQRLKELRQEMLQHMVDDKLIAEQAKELKLTVTDTDLERAVADVMARNHLSRSELADALKQEGKTIAAYKRDILKPQLLRLRVINVRVRSRVSVSDDEVKALYQKSMRDLGVQTKVRARHIFVALPEDPTAAQVAAQKQKAAAILAKVRGRGADFAALARELSEDPVTREDGGDLGYFTKGTLPGNIEDVVFALKKDDIAGPLRTDRGFHIIQVTDRQESGARPFAEVKEDLYQQLYAEKLEKATKSWVSELRKKAHIDIR